VRQLLDPTRTPTSLTFIKGSLAGYTLDPELVVSTSKGSNSNTSNGRAASNCDHANSDTSDKVEPTASENGVISKSGNVDANFPSDLVLRTSTASPLRFDKVLPGELRNEVYEHLLADIPLDFRVKEDRLRLIKWSTNRTDTSKQPYLLRLCLLPFISPLVSVECISIFLMRSTFFSPP
jgi:hypothetical protein